MKEITLYIPESTCNAQVKFSEVVQAATDKIVEVSGGATVTQGEGYYVRQDNGKLDKEITFMISTFVDPSDTVTVKRLSNVIGQIVADMKKRYNQESVLVKTVEVQPDFF